MLLSLNDVFHLQQVHFKFLKLFCCIFNQSFVLALELFATIAQEGATGGVQEGANNLTNMQEGINKTANNPNPDPNDPNNPQLPCLKCHGTFDQLAPGLVDVDGDLAGQGILEVEYPYDLALGYKKGDIRGACTVKIPVVEGEDD